MIGEGNRTKPKRYFWFQDCRRPRIQLNWRKRTGSDLGLGRVLGKAVGVSDPVTSSRGQWVENGGILEGSNQVPGHMLPKRKKESIEQNGEGRTIEKEVEGGRGKRKSTG